MPKTWPRVGWFVRESESYRTGLSYHNRRSAHLEPPLQTIAEALGNEANIVHIPSDFIASVVPRLSGTLLGDKSRSVVFDNSKIKSFVPGFQATIPFREGIRRTVAWFNADEKRRRVDDGVNAEMNRIIEAYG